MIDVRYNRGVILPGANLWLDPPLRKPFAFVSHAHSDHTGHHDRILATEATARLAAARAGIEASRFDVMSFGEVRDFGGFRARLIPAGHVLGSAQIHIEMDAGDLLYTGDFKLRHGLSSEVAGHCAAETLVMETTYGLPEYQFPPSEEVIAGIVKFCAEALEEGDIPVLLGYSLGKAQEILAALAGTGFPVMLHGSIAKMAAIYGELGCPLPEYRTWKAAEAAGCVLLCPPAAAASRAVAAISNRRVAAVTGWALHAGAVHRMRVDAAFPLSDHAGYDDLLAHVEAVAPRRVLTLHGFAREFARDLRARGIEAWALTGPNQLEWDAMVSTTAPAKTPAPPTAPTALRSGGFEGFVSLCENIKTATGKLDKIRLLANFLRVLRANDLRHVAVWLTGQAFPRCDERRLHVGPALIRQSLSESAGIPQAMVRAASMRNNDTGLTVAGLLAGRPGPYVAHTIGQVAAIFASISSKTGPLAKAEALSGALRGMHPIAASYFVRIITGDLRIGIKEGLVEDGIAAAFSVEADSVRHANMLLGDIGEAAALASERRTHSVELTVFRPVKCMLASPEPDARAVWERLGSSGSVWLEEKMDGVRAQIHCRAGRAEIFSRDLKPFSAAFPEIISAVRHLDAVLDGEIVAWDNDRPLPFASLQRRLGRQEVDLFFGAGVPVRFFAFDLLASQGTTWLDRPLQQRRRQLESLSLREPICIAPVSMAHSATEIDGVFDAARSSGHEGLVAKDPCSPYVPGRRGLAWIKLKKRFATIDAVVVAAEYGHGRRSRVLSDLTFAIRDGTSLLPIGKAYTGLTDAEIETLTSEFLAHAVNQTGNRLEVEPRIILEIAFDAITPSSRHASGLALRFPRIVRIRRDKTPDQIDTLKSCRALLARSAPAN
jgi:DNA ligase 1